MIGAALGVAKLGARIPGSLGSPPDSVAASRIQRLALADLARGFGIAIEHHGQPAGPGTLFVANHVSWADVAVLGSVIDTCFVSRADVAGWPLVGPLARRAGTIFVARERRASTADQADAIRARLRSGRSVLLFAEGTTSDGADVLPFRSSLLAAADAAEAVQPVMLRYLAPDGSALPPRRAREVAWIGDDRLLPNLRALLRSPVLARVELLAPIASPDRKALAVQARAAIRAAHAAAPNRSRYRAEIASTGTTRNTSTVLNW
ncbi:lysophospholipid acyltransferase family protein [Sphingomonas sp.]|uniref:lysophospholipid acyltransferase family protein n=1 Tax=Sphingomonas sp. TaxID=28214 RepID=UPI001B2F2EFE|nr:lysophospholipid acyltransferase family protein [Sphingomonas sp.]MBO9711697.1 1-acyl-sn-glycerol-3-phosphate acyltransferase [Sphingomonas sp.]